ncbi:hypothetical protein [Shewanella aestuarii]|uniref:Uncharacterized protein n=1 Tax=Shewanella aestuarii TaxID=1028752 RepID=A0A6G9QRB0_9GAMM|nr:hypothetical protein [Shewanella aestuarii]QIR16341.1 hypothetical protein HBH39_17805 [Shewanella aestuarii]
MQSIVIDNLVLVALVKAIGNILTAAVPSITTYIIGKKLIARERLKRKLNVALMDIQYLLMVEALHCREHMEYQGKSNKRTIRNLVNQETKFIWSGKNTLSQIDKAMENDLNNIVKDNTPVRPSRYYSKY